jgi:hypothetical protein
MIHILSFGSKYICGLGTTLRPKGFVKVFAQFPQMLGAGLAGLRFNYPYRMPLLAFEPI